MPHIVYVDVVLELVGLATEVHVSNTVVVDSRSGVGAAQEVPQVVVMVLLDEAGQEPVAGYEYQMCCHSFWNRTWAVMPCLQWTGGLMKKTLSAQAEVWPILFEYQQVPACL